MAFTIKHGAFIRASAAVSSSESTYWTKGRILSLNSSAQIVVYATPNTHLCIFVALENRPDTTATLNTVTKFKAGAPSGEQTSYIVDTAVIQMDQNLESGITFTAGTRLYASTNGKVTTSGNSVGAYSPVIGMALSDANSGDANRPLTWLFDVQY